MYLWEKSRELWEDEREDRFTPKSRVGVAHEVEVMHSQRNRCTSSSDRSTINVLEMIKVLYLGWLWYSHPSPLERSSMRQVQLILNGDVQLPEVPLSKYQFDYMLRSAPDDLS